MSKLNETDGVMARPTQLGNVAITIPADYLDDDAFSQRGSKVPDMTLVLGREDARKLAHQILSIANTVVR